MTIDTSDTIAAIASPPGGALRGIVRISGPQTASCLHQLFGEDIVRGMRQPTVVPRQLALDELGAVPVEAYVWPNRRSYTRQPTAELHTLGSPPILDGLLRAVYACGVRPAAAGEFTMRAFLAGRLDLTQAEAVLGVIEAANRRELNIALAQLAGGLAAPLLAIRQQSIDLLADLEAGLDFVDEDIEFVSAEQLQRRLAEQLLAVADIQRQMVARGSVGRVPRVVLRGRPNSGKSSLLNALAGEMVALVADAAGTTRDYVARQVEWNELTFELVDTAGIEPAREDHTPRSRAQEMAAKQQQSADLELLCVDLSREPDAWELQQAAIADPQRIVVGTKVDLRPAGGCRELPVDIATSSHRRLGLDDLRVRLTRWMSHCGSQEAGFVNETAARCRDSLRRTQTALESARQLASTSGGDELVAVEIRSALDDLGQMVGAVYTDDLLDRIFSRFCVGK